MRDIKYKFYNPRTSKKSNKEVIKEETIRQIHQLHPLYNVQTLSLSLSQLSVSLSFFSSKNILKVKNVWTKIEQQPVSPFKTLTDVVCCCSHRWNSSSMASEQETTPRTGEQKCVDSAPHRPNVISTDKTTTTKKRKEDENRRRRLKLLRQSNWSYLLYRVHFNLDTNQKIWSEKNLAQLFWGYLIFCCVRCFFFVVHSKSPHPPENLFEF